MKYPTNKKGFTLIELTIYIAILGVLVAIVISSMIGVTRSYATLRSARAVHFSAISSFQFVSPRFFYKPMFCLVLT